MAKKITFLKGNLCIFKCFIDVSYIFLFCAKEKLQNAPPICVEFCHVRRRFYFRGRIHGPDSVMRFALKDYLQDLE